MLDRAARHQLDAASGLLSFDADALTAYSPRRLKVLWIENVLDCRMWGYYCDIRDAMAKLHDMCTPSGGRLCMPPKFTADVAIVGPRYSINIATADETVGFDRTKHAHLPLLVLQNKMYTPNGWREIVGNVSAKLEWVRDAGASAAFTWLTEHRDFTRRSGVPHHWLPFGVDVDAFGARAGRFGDGEQPYGVGFTGASGADKYPLRASMLAALQAMNLSRPSFFGTWSQTALNRADPRSWKAGDRKAYVQQMAKARIWLSTLGPSDIVGTRYFEVLASGTTLLMCNRPSAGKWVYDGLFEDGVHVVMFDGVDDMQAKVRHYLSDEPARQAVVSNAHALARKLHSWDRRAMFVSYVAEKAIERQQSSSGAGGRNTSLSSPAPHYEPPAHARFAADPSFLGCFASKDRKESGLVEPPRSRNKRKLWRYEVASCIAACRGSRHELAALGGGGFVGGNGHAHARCLCAPRSALVLAPPWHRRPNSECATTCALHDARPCGGPKSFAVFGAWNASASTVSSQEKLTHEPVAGGGAAKGTRRNGGARRRGGRVRAGS